MRRLALTSFALFAFSIASVGQQLLIEELTELWIGSAWKNYNKYTYEHNFNLNVDTSKTHQWDSVNGVWNNVIRAGFTYNGNVQLTESVNQSNYTGTWNNSSRRVYTYNGNGMEADYTSFGWVVGAWLESYKYSHTYDSSGNRIETLEQYWDMNTSGWKPSSRITNTYTNGVVTQSLKEVYDENASDWENNSLSTYLLDSNSAAYTEKVQQGWNSQGSMWVNNSRQTYSYNGNGTSDSTTTFSWNQNGSTWDSTGVQTFSYNQDNTVHQTVNQLNQGGGQWVNNSRTTYTYSTFQGVDKLEVIGLQVYPNPTTDFINLRLKSEEQTIATILNTEGQVVVTQQLRGKVSSIPLAHLPAGSYFIHLEQDGKLHVASFVKM